MNPRARFFLGLGVSLLVVLGVGLLAFGLFQAIVSHVQKVEYILRLHTATADLQAAVQRAVMAPSDYLITGDPTERNAFARSAAEIDAHFAAVELLIGETPEGRALLSDTRSEWLQARALAEVILALPNPVGSVVGARHKDRMEALVDEFVGDFVQFSEQQEAQIATAMAVAHWSWRWAGLTLGLAVLLAVVSRLTPVWYLFRRLARSLVAPLYATKAIAYREPRTWMTVDGHDERPRLEQVSSAMTDHLQRRLTELHALAEISRAFREITDRQALFAELSTLIATLLDAEQCAFVLRDENGGDFVLQWPAYGMTQEQATLGRFSMAQMRALLERIPEDGALIVNHPIGEEGLVPELTRAWNERTLLFARLQVGDRVLGSIRVANKRSGTGFTPDDAWLLGLIANEAALAIEKMRLYEALENSLQRRTTETEALNAIVAAAVTAPDLKCVLQTAVEHLLQVLDLEAGAVYLPTDEDPDTLRLVVQQGFPGAFEETVPRSLVEPRFFHRQAANETRGTARNPPSPTPGPNDIRSSHTDHRPSANSEWQTFAEIPLRFHGRTVGILHLGSRQMRSFSPADLTFLKAAGDLLGSSVENARLRRQVQRRLQHTHILATLATMLNRTVDVQTVLNQTIQTLTEHLGLSSCWFLTYTEDPLSPFAFAVAYQLPPVLQAEGAFQGPCRCGTMALSGELTEAVNLVTCERLAGHPPEKTGGLYHHASVPVRSGERLLGLLNLALPEGRYFDTDELDLLTAVAETLGVALERARLHERVRQQRVEEQETLLHLSQTLVGLTDPQAVIAAVSRTVQQALQVAYVSVMTPDPTGRWLVLMGGAGWEADQIGSYRVEIATSQEGHVFCTGEAEQQFDVRDEGPFACSPELRARGVVSHLTVPLQGEEGIVGTLCAYTAFPRVFKSDEIRLLSLIASQAAVALERTHAYQAAYRRLKRLATLYEVARATTDLHDLSQLLDRALIRLLELLPADAASVYLREQDGKDVLTLVAYRGFSEENAAFFTRHRVGDPTVTGQTAARGELIFIEDTAAFPYTPEARQIVQRDRICSHVAVPLRANSEVIGVLNIAWRHRQRLDAETRDLLTGLADILASGIRNVRLLGETHRRAHQLAILNDLAREMTGFLEVRELCTTVARRLCQAFGYLNVGIFTVDQVAGEVVLQGMDGAYRTLAEVGEYRQKLGEGIIGRAAEAGEMLLANDTRQHPDFFELEGMRIRSELAIPLKVDEQVIGVLNVDSEQLNAFDESDVAMLSTVADQLAVALEKARLYEQLEDAFLETVLALANALDARDAYTADHSQRLAAWAEATARALGCREEEVRAIRWAALLHDIGKLGIPDEILRKPGPLTDEEWELVKRHPEVGAAIIAPVKKLADVVPIIRAHQERWDGTGYPDGLRGEEIPLGARILAVVDAYGAIIDERPYNPARSHEEAVAELRRCAGTQFDPRVVETFVGMMNDERGMKEER